MPTYLFQCWKQIYFLLCLLLKSVYIMLVMCNWSIYSNKIIFELKSALVLKDKQLLEAAADFPWTRRPWRPFQLWFFNWRLEIPFPRKGELNIVVTKCSFIHYVYQTVTAKALVPEILVGLKLGLHLVLTFASQMLNLPVFKRQFGGVEWNKVKPLSSKCSLTSKWNLDSIPNITMHSSNGPNCLSVQPKACWNTSLQPLYITGL